MKRTLLFVTNLLAAYYGVLAQSSADYNQVINKLTNYISTHDPEKAYLQFDKPYYAAGDTLYFKAYITQGGHNLLSTTSGILYVDLINTENRIDKSLRLHLDNGICWGDFVLPDSLRTGNYRVRAYTRWMQNEGSIDFFDRLIPIGAILKTYVHTKPVKQNQGAENNKTDVQFFPEGGTLVENVKVRVAFKATGPDGLGRHVLGTILDNENKPVCSFESSHLGMGDFIFIPGKSKTYKARISFDDGTQSYIDLPAAEKSGISLAIIDDSTSSISLKVMANAPYYQTNQNKDFLLVFYSGGKAISYSYKQDASIVLLNMDRKMLQTGVSRITLFSQEGEPLCERLFFVQNNDQLGLQIQPDKTVYKKKEKVELTLNAKTAKDISVNGQFSMTIINETLLPRDEKNERNIFTDLLLTSDLKGYVEQPNYYFRDTSAETVRDLDLLMLIQGYRHFEWKRVLGKDSDSWTIKPEKGLDIKGKITNEKDKPIENGTITLIPPKGGSLLNTESDSAGFFHFSNLVFTDTAHLVLNAANSSGGKNTRITYFNNDHPSPFTVDLPPVHQMAEDTIMRHYIEKAGKFYEEMEADYPGRFKNLNPVTVKGFKQDNQYRTQSIAGAGHADQVVYAEDIEKKGGNLSTNLNGRLHGVNFIGGVPYLSTTLGYAVSPMLVVLDGVEMKSNSNNSIDLVPVDQVASVEVLMYSGESAYGVDGANGVLIITTKDGSETSKNNVAVGVLPITPVGFYKARTFYSPKYDHADGNVPEPELRSTIYWNPDIKTSQDSHASVNYFNANSAGTYKVTVEGIDQSGNIGRLVYRYRVE
jgi:predicted pyridoxine 5'-phosphate oxidase superfamily flavin-nucleotide-binding protein